MKTVFYSKDAQFKLTDEEFEKFIPEANQGKKVYIPRLRAVLSNMFIWAGDQPYDTNKVKLKDGTIAVLKFGTWVDDKDNNVKINLDYYPELREEMSDEEIKQLT